MKNSERLNKGCAITIRTDEIVDDNKRGLDRLDTPKVFVVIEDQEGNEILRVKRNLWNYHDEKLQGFTKEMRSDIIENIMALYG